MKDFEKYQLIAKSSILALQKENLIQMFNMRSQMIESELSLPDKVIAMTCCNEGGELVVLCANN